jgi:hypothetical protein
MGRSTLLELSGMELHEVAHDFRLIVSSSVTAASLLVVVRADPERRPHTACCSRGRNACRRRTPLPGRHLHLTQLQRAFGPLHPRQRVIKFKIMLPIGCGFARPFEPVEQKRKIEKLRRNNRVLL